jgi:hypothetical protein
MSLTQQDIKRIKHEMSAKYDVNFDKELLPLICEILETKQHVQSETEQMKKTVESATLLLHKKASQPSSQYVYQSDWQAFWHGFGKFGLPLVLAVGFSFWGYLLWFNRGQNEQMAKDIEIFLKNHDQIASFQDLSDYQVVQELKIGDQTLEYIQMPVVPTMKQALPGKNVVVEFKKDKKGNPTDAVIKIPLRMLNK